jgi:hypothetical protein
VCIHILQENIRINTRKQEAVKREECEEQISALKLEIQKVNHTNSEILRASSAFVRQVRNFF